MRREIRGTSVLLYYRFAATESEVFRYYLMLVKWVKVKF